MEVVKLKIKDENKKLIELNEISLDKIKGLVEEPANRDSTKQISILSKGVRDSIDNRKIDGLCTERFYENISIEGLESKKLTAGDKFVIGETVLEVTSIGKRCFDSCRLVESKKKCKLAGDVIFAKVLKNGTIKKNDIVNIEK